MLKTLGPSAARFLEVMAQKNRALVTVEDAVETGHSSRHQAAVFLGQLARRGVLTRLRRGLFAITPFGKEREYGNPFLVAHALAGPGVHFISHLGALAHHDLLLQPSRTVHVSVAKPKRPLEVGPTRFEFIPLPPARLWGFRDEWVTPIDRVPVADLERTLLDGCVRPDLCGGIVDVGRALWRARAKLHYDRLADYAERFGKFAPARRLACLLDVLELGPAGVRERLRAFGNRSAAYVLLDPVLPPDGPFRSRWRLRMNVAPDELLAASRT